jgi:hypothetical protein
MPTEPTKPEAKPDFGQGRYSVIKMNVYDDGQSILKLSPKAAERLAESIATELGGYFSADGVFAKIGIKQSKTGPINLSEVVKLKGLAQTNNLKVLIALDYIAKAGQHNILWSKTHWTFTTALVEYFASIEEKVKELEKEEAKA